MSGRLGVLVVALLFASSVSADKLPDKKKAPASPPPPPAAEPAAGSANPADELPPHITGPKVVDLGNQSEVELPAGKILFERDVARKALESGGANVEAVMAAVFDPNDSWGVIFEYEGIGYIDDSDAGELDADELLKSYQEGTTQQNAKRRAMGAPELTIEGWSEKPRYDKASHHLVWGIRAHDSTGKVVINYFTRVLGRNGYMSVNLIDDAAKIETAKVAAAPVLAGTRFKAGALYTDHKSGDKDSGIGLKALVLGGAGIAVVKAAKAGIIIKLLLVFKKAFIFIAAAVAGFFKWLFGRKKNVDVAAGPPPTTPSNPG